MSMQNVMAALAVSDIRAASAWYTKLLGRGPTETPMAGLLEWEFPGGGWLQVFEKPDVAGHGWVSIVEDDVDNRVASLPTAHIRVDREMSSEKSLAIVVDPDGNRIVFALPRNSILHGFGVGSGEGSRRARLTSSESDGGKVAPPGQRGFGPL